MLTYSSLSVWDPESNNPSNATPMKLPGRYTAKDPFVQNLVAKGKSEAEIHKACKDMIARGLGPIDWAEVVKEEATEKANNSSI